MLSPNQLRKVDLYLGAPLCWLLAQLLTLNSFIKRVKPSKTNSYKKVLVLQLSESGSMVLLIPTLQRLQQAGIDYRIVTFANNGEALNLIPGIDPQQHFKLRIERPQWFIRDLISLHRWVRHEGFDLLLDLELFSHFSKLLVLGSGISQRAGFICDRDLGKRALKQIYPMQMLYNAHQHMAQNYLYLAQQALKGRDNIDPNLWHFDAKTPDLPHLPLSEHSLKRVKGLLFNKVTTGDPSSTHLVLLNCNSSQLLPQRRWPEGHYIDLIQRLLDHSASVNCLLIGSEQDQAVTAKIAGKVHHPRCIDIAGELHLQELPTLFSLARLLITSDSGPAHFAALTNIPSLVLFGPETPTLYRPLGEKTQIISRHLSCSPCVRATSQRLCHCRDNLCMQQISVAEVLKRALPLIDSQSNVVPLHPLTHMTQPLKQKGGR